MRLSYADGKEEVIVAGDLFYLPPGHGGSSKRNSKRSSSAHPRRTSQVLDVVKRNAAMAQCLTSMGLAGGCQIRIAA